ncbi:MAG: hypothetical protein ISR74_06735 [Candidatus Thioglobus sp.]|nr:hypothetical protein [Candidatus Thioglobus pontius]MBL6985272.1 hypothetical protein [Candidatus Thioglobus sp.]
MTTTIGIRDLARSADILKNFDYLRIEDKKTHERKGLVVSSEYADQIEKILTKIIAKKKKEKVNKIMQLAGTVKIHSRFNDLTSREIREKIAHEKYGE